MTFRSLFGALGMAAIVASSGIAAVAQPAPPNYNYREQSLANVGRFATQTGHIINKLQAVGNGFGGHRDAAIADLRVAQNELIAAAQWAEAHGYQMPVPNPNRAPNPYRPRNPQPWSIAKAQSQVQHMIGRLQRDSRDFGGHRAAAIDALQRANVELGAAVQYGG